MATSSTPGFSPDPKAFCFSGNSPTPLCSPSTTYLTSVPSIETPSTSSQRPGWQPLSGATNDIYIPDPPTPRTPRLRNNTPTPAESTPGSWRGRRRQGQAVDRAYAPPRSRWQPPGEVNSTSPDMPFSASGLPQSPAEDARLTAPATLRSSSNSSNGSPVDSDAQSADTVIPVQNPAADIASHNDQYDGAQDGHATTRGSAYQSFCKKLCDSLRSIPSKLHLVPAKTKASNCAVERRGSSQDTLPARPLAATTVDKSGSWWSKASLRSKQSPQVRKPIPGRRCRRSSLGVFLKGGKGTGTTNSTAMPSQCCTPAEVTPFDDPRAPQAFGAPTHEEDSSSPTIPGPFSAEADEIARQQRLSIAREIAKQRQRQSSAEQVVIDDVGNPVLTTGSWTRMK
ncbi:MAG: hypothetical protein Q9182_006526 [Xanthomendoza sp. 2 TL-2023]